MTEHVESSITVDVPARTAYAKWTDFEDFPQFMEGIDRVEQTGPNELHWEGEIAGKDKEWDAKVIEQRPEEQVSWRSVSGAENHGTVKFRELGDARTEVRLQMEVEPETTIEDIGTWLGLVENRVEGDLENFKDYIEQHGAASAGSGRPR